MGLTEEVKKALRGEPSRVIFSEGERMQDADAVDNLEILDKDFSQPQYHI